MKNADLNEKNIYLIYSMGKVGCTTIYRSLEKEFPSADVFRVHFLSDNYLNNILPSRHKSFHNNITLGKNILSHIAKNPESRIKIITMTREPVERAISDLFQNWEHLYDDIENVPFNVLKQRIESLNHNYTLNWFDVEFKEYLNFDIYKHHFSIGRGYEIYSFGKYDILCMKLEKLDSIADLAFDEFLGQKINLSNRNSSQYKKGKDAYSFLKSQVKIDKDVLMNVYNSKYVRKFYSKNEIDGFVDKWA